MLRELAVADWGFGAQLCVRCRNMDLNNWTATKQYALSYAAVAYGNAAGNDEFVAVGNQSLVRSRDEGATWINDTVTSGADPTKVYYGVAYGSGVFVAVGSVTSRWNGSAWSPQITQTINGVTYFMRAVGHGTPSVGGLFVAVGDAGKIFTSPDGVTWTARTSPTSSGLRTIAFGNQLFLVGADSGEVLTSPDGGTWTLAASPSGSFLRVLMFANNLFVGVDNGKKVWTSSNGASWTNLSPVLASVDPMNGIDLGFDTFALSGVNGSIHTSPNGVVWTKRISGSTQHFGGIAYGKNRFVAVGDQGQIVRSPEYPSGDLSALTCSGGSLTPGFDSLVTTYGANVARNVVTVTPTSEDPGATIRVRFDSGSDLVVASGTPSAAGDLAGRRTRTFYITVTARNNATKVYTLTIYRRGWLSILSWWIYQIGGLIRWP